MSLQILNEDKKIARQDGCPDEAFGNATYVAKFEEDANMKYQIS